MSISKSWDKYLHFPAPLPSSSQVLPSFLFGYDFYREGFISDNSVFSSCAEIPLASSFDRPESLAYAARKGDSWTA